MENIPQIGELNESQKINGSVQIGQKQISVDNSEWNPSDFTVQKCFDQRITGRDRQNDFNNTKDTTTTLKQDLVRSTLECDQMDNLHQTAEKSETRLKFERKWLVLMAAFLSKGLGTGFPFNLSVLYVEWLQEFGKSNSETSLIQSVCTGVLLIGGVVSGIIVHKYGPMKSGICGGLLVFVGLSVSFVATSIIHLVLTIGILSGLGFSLVSISTHTIVGMYFNGKQRLMALAFISFGSGCGGSVFPVILEELVLEYGWRGAVLIIAGIMLHLVHIACLYKIPKSRDKHERLSFVVTNSEQYDHTTEVKQATIVATISDPVDKNVVVNIRKTTSKRDSCTTKEIKRLEDIEGENKNKSVVKILKGIFKNKIFMCFCFAQALCMASFNSVLIFFFDYYQSKGISRSDAVSIYLYMNIVNTLFRFLSGILKQLPHVSVLSIPAVCALIGTVSMAAFPLSGSSFTLNLAAACGYGLGIGGVVTVVSLSIGKLVGQENYSAGLGISMTVSGILNTASGPISGYIRDTTGNYDVSFYSAAAALFATFILFFITMVCRHHDNGKKGSRFEYEVNRQKYKCRSSVSPLEQTSAGVNM